MTATFTIERTGFDTISLDIEGGGPFGLQAGTTGLGHAPLAIFTQATVGEGSLYLGERAQEQPMSLNVILLGDDTTDTAKLASILYNTLRSRTGVDAPRIVATFTTGEVFEIEFRYVSGLEGDGDDLPNVALKTLVVLCPRPFWTARESTQVAIRSSGGSPVAFLSRFGRLHLGVSSSFGQFEVENTGDEPAFVTWTVVGPAEAASAAIDGVGWSLDASLTEGDRRVLDGRSKTVVDGVGVSKYTELGTAPKFPMLEPGKSTVDIAVDGAEPGTWEVSDEVLYTNRLIQPSLTGAATKWASWSNGHGTHTHPTSGFAGGTAGYMQVAFTGAAAPDASHRFEVDAVAGEVLSPSMEVLSSKDQVVQGVAWVLDADGNVLRMVAAPTVETPAGVVTRVSIPGMILDVLPADTAKLIFSVSVFAPLGQAWANTDTFRASHGSVTETDSVLDFFDGDSSDSTDWTSGDDASTSVQYALELVGASEVSMSWKPRRALIY